MSAIGPGDWLQAIKPWPWNDFLVVGNVYVVESLSEPSACEVCNDVGPGLNLVGDEMAVGSWCPCFFRPLKPPGEETKAKEASPPELETA